MKTVYLKKACDEGICSCECGDGRIALPSQMDCPWCGCGWLFTCISCGGAFTFAEGIEVDSTPEALAHEDYSDCKAGALLDEGIAAWVMTMEQMLAEVEPGKRYVFLDDKVLPADATNVEFNGQDAHHCFDRLPHVQGEAVLREQLGKPEYWSARSLGTDSWDLDEYAEAIQNLTRLQDESVAASN